MSNKKTLTFKNTLYNIIDNGEIGNGWKYVEVLNKKHEFSLPQCLYYKGDVMKNLLTYSEYINHLDAGKDFMNDFVKDIFRECYPGSKNPICKVKENLMMGGGKISDNQIGKFMNIIKETPTIRDDDIKKKYFKGMKKEEERPVVKVDTLIKLKNEIAGMTEDNIKDLKQENYETYNIENDPNKSGFNINVKRIKELYKVLPKSNIEEANEKDVEDVKREEEETEEKKEEEVEEVAGEGEEAEEAKEEEVEEVAGEGDEAEEAKEEEEVAGEGDEAEEAKEEEVEEVVGEGEEAEDAKEEEVEEPVVPPKYEVNKELSEFMGDDKYLVASKKTEEMPENYLYLDYKLLTQSGNPFVLFSIGELVKETELYLKREDDYFKVEYGEKRTFDMDDISRSNDKINRLAKLIVRDVVKTKEKVNKLGEGFTSLKELVETFEKDEKNKNKTLFRKGYENIPSAPSTVKQTTSAKEENRGDEATPVDEKKGGEEVAPVEEKNGEEEKKSETPIEV